MHIPARYVDIHHGYASLLYLQRRPVSPAVDETAQRLLAGNSFPASHLLAYSPQYRVVVRLDMHPRPMSQSERSHLIFVMGRRVCSIVHVQYQAGVQRGVGCDDGCPPQSVPL